MRKLFVMLFISLLAFACQEEKSVSVNITVKDKSIDEGVYFGHSETGYDVADEC